MKSSTIFKTLINRFLSWFGLELITKKRENAEVNRLRSLKSGHFDQPVFPVLSAFENCRAEGVLEKVAKQRYRWMETFTDQNTGFQMENEYFTSPDAEILTAMVEILQPKQIIEIGSGNSTRLFRVALQQNQNP